MKSQYPGSNPGKATMNTFKYNGKIYSPKNLNKKLKQLNITIDDIEFCEDPYTKKKQIDMTPNPDNPELNVFINKNGATLHSIYKECHDKNYKRIKDSSKEELRLFLLNNKCYYEQFYKEAKQKFDEY